MPRTIGLVAILVCAAVVAAAGAVTPPQPPPPPPIPGAIAFVPPPAGVPGAAAAAVVPNPPSAPQVSFSISNADPVAEGKALIFHITRTGDDGQVHEIHVSVGPPNLMVEREKTLRFEPGEPAQRDLGFQTASGLPGDGPHDVEALLDKADNGASIGVRLARATITDVPLPPAMTYGLQADPDAKREQNISFTLTRTSPQTPAKVPYRVEQDGSELTADAATPRQANFPGDELSTPIIIPAGQFSPCGGPLTVRLSQPDGTELSAIAEFSEPVPGWCNPKRSWWDIIIDDYGPDLVVLVLVGICLTGAAVAHYIFKLPVNGAPKPPADGEQLPETQADVEPSLEIEPGAASFRPLEEPASRWPKFSADVTIEPGGFYVTQPLPRLEPDDG